MFHQLSIKDFQNPLHRNANLALHSRVTILRIFIGLSLLMALIVPQLGAVQAQSSKKGITLGRGGINDIAWSGDGKQIAIATTIGVWLYNPAQITDDPQYVSATDNVRSVAFSPDSKTLAFGEDDELVTVWDIASKQKKSSLKGHNGAIYGLRYSPDGKSIASASNDETVIIWDAESGDMLQTLKGHTSTVRAVAFSPDNKTVASASTDGTVKLWTVASGKELRTLKQPNDGSTALYSVAFSLDGKTILAGGESKTAIFWTADTGAVAKTADTSLYDIYRVAFSVDGKQAVVAGSSDYLIHLIDPASGTDSGKLTGHTSDVVALALSPDGKSLISGDDSGNLRWWDFASSKGKVVLEGQFAHEFQTSATSPDGTVIAVSYYGDYVALLWKTDGSSKTPLTLKGHTGSVYSLAFSSDGTQIAGGSTDGTIIIWSASTGKPTTTIKGMSSTPYTLAFNADASLIATGDSDGTVGLFDTNSGDSVATFKGHTNTVRSIKFSADGKHLISASDDGTVRIWDVPAQ